MSDLPSDVLTEPDDQSREVVLTGNNLSIAEVVRISRLRTSVLAHADALERVSRSHTLLIQASLSGQPIYGLNRGVGINKDRIVLQGNTLDPEVHDASEQFNRRLLLSHSVGVGPYVKAEIVRAMMLARVNTMLLGASGAQPAVVHMLLDFLNHAIHPLVPSRGSIGEADITILPYIGLAMMGMGEVIYRDNRIPASQALQQADLTPLAPYAKDGLAILSSNAYSAGMAALVLHDSKQLLETANLVFALSLEGLNGNVAPFLEPAHALRPYESQGVTARKIRDHLAGSYLWHPHPERALQDPLSFRDVSHIHGAALDVLLRLQERITTQLNASDDNPAVILDDQPASDTPPQLLRYYVQTPDACGMVLPTANFEPINWVVYLEALSIALSHVSRASCFRMLKLYSPQFTQLTRALALSEQTAGLGVLQKTFSSIDAEIRHLSQPVSVDVLPTSGDIEDHGTNTPFVVQQVARILDNLYVIVGFSPGCDRSLPRCLCC